MVGGARVGQRDNSSPKPMTKKQIEERKRRVRNYRRKILHSFLLATRTANTTAMRESKMNVMNVTLILATGNTPLVRAICVLKYLLTPKTQRGNFIVKYSKGKGGWPERTNLSVELSRRMLSDLPLMVRQMTGHYRILETIPYQLARRL